MPATGWAGLLLIVSAGLGLAAWRTRSRRLALAAGCSLLACLACVGLLLLGRGGM